MLARSTLIAFTLIAATLAPAASALDLRPDLVAKKLTVTPSSPFEGQAVSLHLNFTNGGNSTAGSFRVRFLDGNVTFAERNVTGLGIGEHLNLSATWTATRGSHTLRAVVDATGAVNETSESNNELARSVFVPTPGQPDLVVEAVWTSPFEPVEGEAFDVLARIRNVGNAPAGSSVAAKTVDGSAWSSVGVPPIGAGQWTVVAFWGGYFQPGVHNVTVYADAWGNVLERSETNNARSRDVQVLPAPDLALKIESVEKRRIRTDVLEVANPVGSIDVTIRVCNVGGSTLRGANVTVNATTSFDGVGETRERVGNLTVAGLRAGSCERATFEWPALHALGDVTIEAFGASAQWERNRENDRDEEDTFVLLGGFGGVVLSDALP